MADREDEIAVIGYAAVLPGAPDADAAWKVLIDGRCTVTEVPEDRWASSRFLDQLNDEDGHTYTRRAGVLDDPYRFDAEYFGITPREAAQMDPQQRILLQTVARALDHAGVDPAALDRGKTGVFVGASSSDHSTVALQDPRLIDAQYMLGNTLSILSNRISYQWDFGGPSYTVDTACSSGLFALDQARRAIAEGLVTTAVVGGVNMLSSPLPFIGFSKAGMLSRDGLCRAFAKDADGYVRSEGAVVFVLQRADVARKARRRIRSVLVGTATNTAGRTSGIALPSMSRQRALIEDVLGTFDIDPDRLALVEAHGTGTRVGDPREAQALGETYGKRRSKPLPVGSAKSNFGHLEPVAGLVGLLKVQRALETGVIPASLHADELNPDIDFDGYNLDVVRAAKTIGAGDEPWLGAVNSFGFGGANAHAIIRQPTQTEAAGKGAESMPPSLLISAASEASLRGLAADWMARAERNEPGVSGAVATANAHLRRHRYRLCVSAQTAANLASQLDAWLEEGNAARPGAQAASGISDAPVAFVFGGNGALWDGMARHVFMRDPVFRDSFRETADLFSERGWRDLTELLMAPELEDHLGEAKVAQPLLFSIQIALCDALKAAGLVPRATLGHSLGEVAAAVVAGRISRETGVHIIATRSAAFEPLRDTGGMAAVAASVEDTQRLIEDGHFEVEIAADNAPKSVTVSGDVEELQRLLKAARKKRIAGRVLKVDYPYHSSRVDVLRTELMADLDGTRSLLSDVRFYSGCRGEVCDKDPLGADYWWENARSPVAFRSAVEAMAEDGYRVFLEISPKTVLRAYLRASLDAVPSETCVLESLDSQKADQRDAASIVRAVACAGGQVDAARVLGPRRQVTDGLPSYPFGGERYRLHSDTGIDIFGRRPQHEFLGARIDPRSWVWTGSVSLSRAPWLADHKVGGRVLVPATAILEMMLSAGREALNGGDAELRDLEILRPIELPEDAAVGLRVTHEPAGRVLRLETGGDDGWAIVSQATLYAADGHRSDPLPVTALPVETGHVYAALRAVGLDYGPAFARLQSVSVDGARAHAVLDPDTDRDGFLFDPAVADSALHAAFALLGEQGAADGRPYVPTRVDRTVFHGGGPVTSALLEMTGGSRESVAFDVRLLSDEGQVVVSLHGLRLRPVPQLAEEVPTLWDETLVPLVQDGPGGMTPPPLRGEGDEPTDLDVLRGALAGRLAWELVEGADDDETVDPRYDVALSWLVESGHATLDDDGAVTLASQCPWPALDELIALIPVVAPAAQSELKSVLSAVTENGRGDAEPLSALQDVLLEAVSVARLSPSRVLAVGDVDDAMIAVLRDLAPVVTVAASDDDALARLKVRIAATGIRFTTLDKATELGRFDLVVGANITQRLTSSERRTLPDTVAGGGAFVLVEETPDVFALLTGRQRSDTVVRRLQSDFEAAGADVTRGAAVRSEAVSIVCGTMGPRAAEKPPALTVTGEGPLADALRAVKDTDDQRAVHVRVVGPGGSLARAAALRDLPDDGSPVWVVDTDPDGAAELTGWRRTVANETGRDLRTVTAPDDTSAQTILDLIAGSHEHEHVIENGSIAAPRVLQVEAAGVRPAGDRSRLVARTRGLALEGLAWEPLSDGPLADDAVEIEVAATGLNFRDVMWAQGLIPPEALENGFAGQCVGMECSGVVSRAGGRSGLSVGQRVIAFAPHAFASHVVVPAASVMPAPENTDLVAAASIPVIFLTADYALNELARIGTDETILIHGGAGGVGIAAIQIAIAAGARVFATAGSPEKRRLLKAFGVDQVFDSRSLAFEEDVRVATGGRGVDVVLNSLAGEAMARSLACLAPFGRFIELGKRDFYENTPVGLRVMRNNISYFAVDADQLLGFRPDAAKRSIERVSKAFADEVYTVPPISVFAAENVAAAFHLMKGAGHIGKIVVTSPKAAAAALPAPVPVEGAWLVTGGTRGFGLETAVWLAERGAAELWLVSRSGKISGEVLERLNAHGIPVHVRAADVANQDAMASVLGEIDAGGARLGGVVHAAMVLDDAYFDDLDDERIANAMEAKLGGARVLDALTRERWDTQFWLYSSVSARFGNPGQAPYVAANRGLEGISRARAAAGLPALAIAWGPIGDAGYLTGAEKTREALNERLGKLLSAREALDRLGDFLETGDRRFSLTIAPMQWGRLRADLPVVAGPLFELVDTRAAEGREADIDIQALIATKGAAEARKVVIGMLVEEAARIMRAAPSEIDPRRPLASMGFDSLMGMSLKIAVEERLAIAMPVASIGDDLSIAGLVQRIFDNIESDAPDDMSEEMARRHLTDVEISDEKRSEIVKAAAEPGGIRREA